MSQLSPPKFIYFDLGNVLLHFSHPRMCQQMAHLWSIDPKQMWAVAFESDVMERHESGKLDGPAVFELLCQRFGSRPDYDEFSLAASHIFTLNVSMMPILGHLSHAGYRLGLLSNINDLHWQFICHSHYALIPSVFDVLALSFEIGAVKPSPHIFESAAQLAGVAPDEIFYTDDIAGHIAGAKQVGFDAVQYTSTPELVEELRKRGIEINY